MSKKRYHPYYVYHVEHLPDMNVPIFEPFEFEEFEKAKSHADFFHALSGIDYMIIDKPQLSMIFNEDKISCF